MFRETNQNPVPQLVELTAQAVQGNDVSGIDIMATLQIRPDEVDIDNYTVRIEFKAAYIIVEPYGARTDALVKHGLRRMPERVEIRRDIETTANTGVSHKGLVAASASGELSPVSTALKMSVDSSHESTRSAAVTISEKESRVVEHIFVEAVGGDRWIVTERDDASLSGQYLAGDRLCRLLKADGRPNRVGAAITAQVKRKDITVAVLQDRRVLPLPTNNSKILSLFVAKKLTELAPDNNSQIITFAQADVDDEG